VLSWITVGPSPRAMILRPVAGERPLSAAHSGIDKTGSRPLRSGPYLRVGREVVIFHHGLPGRESRQGVDVVVAVTINDRRSAVKLQPPAACGKATIVRSPPSISARMWSAHNASAVRASRS
jgi:hypothetical protein